MSVTSTSERELELRTQAAFARTAALLRDVDPAIPLIRSEWTCHDVAAHLLSVLGRYTRRDFTDQAGLSDTPAELATSNRAELRPIAAMTHGDVIDGLEKEFAAYLALDLPLDQRFPFHAGQSIDGAGARSNMLGELLLHGYDVARAADRPWPLDPRDMTLVLNGVMQVGAGWLDPTRARGVDLSVAVTIPGATAQLFRIVDGCCTIRDRTPSDRPDSVIRAPAVPLALMLYHRIGMVVGARRGVLVVGGRRPWRGLRLPGMFLTA